MTKSAWQRTGAFVGTVTAVALVAKTVSPRSSTRVIEAMGKSFHQSLTAQVATPNSYVEPTPDIVIPKRTFKPEPIPYFWSGIYYHVLSLFPQVPTPFRLETWEQAACRLYDFAPDTWEDVETLADLVHAMKSECGTDGE